jgi:two-component sensor histidine kinase
MRLNARQLLQEDPSDTLILLAIEDITARKQAQEAIRASLVEKEVLLREIHHRVKNNLQIIMSLLNLQFANIEDQAIRPLLEDSRRRIGAMALVHEKLYTSPDLARVDMAAYIGSFREQLLQTSGTSDRISLHIHADEVLMTPDVAIPCALLLTELLSNALKHAFPAGQSGQVDIDLRLSNGREVTIVVRDTGVGFPAGVDFRHTASLGLQLVCILTEQLNGTITLDRGHRGTTCTLMFPLETA